MLILTLLGSLFSLVGAVASIWFIVGRVSDRKRVTWHQAEVAVKSIVGEMHANGYRPSRIIGSGRGGAIVGAWISGGFGHVPILAVDPKHEWTEGERTAEITHSLVGCDYSGEDILIVNGEAYWGESIRLLREHIQTCNPRTITVAVFYCNPECRVSVDYKGIVASRVGVIMPWMLESYRSDARRPVAEVR